MSNNTFDKNTLTLGGEVVSEPQPIRGSNYYEFELATKRLSDVIDTIKVVYDSTAFEPETIALIKNGSRIEIKGRVLTYYDFDKQLKKRKTHLRAIAYTINEIDDTTADINEVCFEGFVAKPAICRATLRGKLIADMIISTKHERQVSYVPCIVWDGKTKLAAQVGKGDYVRITGRFQSREYRKPLGDDAYEIKTAYEISASNFEVLV